MDEKIGGYPFDGDGDTVLTVRELLLPFGKIKVPCLTNVRC